MSVSYTPEEHEPVPWRRRAAARVAVAAARLLILFPPRRIRRLLYVLRRGAPPATARQALAARNAVVAVSMRCAAGEGCLQRSLATVVLCRMRGTWPTWSTGVRPDPFRAHAWVEAEGQPVGEPWPPGYYQPVMTVPSRG